jgi:hypothetical protein
MDLYLPTTGGAIAPITDSVGGPQLSRRLKKLNAAQRASAVHRSTLTALAGAAVGHEGPRHA